MPAPSRYLAACPPADVGSSRYHHSATPPTANTGVPRPTVEPTSATRTGNGGRAGVGLGGAAVGLDESGFDGAASAAVVVRCAGGLDESGRRAGNARVDGVVVHAPRRATKRSPVWRARSMGGCCDSS